MTAYLRNGINVFSNKDINQELMITDFHEFDITNDEYSSDNDSDLEL